MNSVIPRIKQELEHNLNKDVSFSTWLNAKWQILDLLLFSRQAVSDSATLWTTAPQTSLSFVISLSLLRLLSIELVMPSHPLLPSFPPALNLPSISVFSNKLALCIRWPKYWNFSISPFNDYSGLISFKIDWFDLPVVQGTLKSLL